MTEDSPTTVVKQQDLGLTIGISCALLLVYLTLAVIVYRPRRRRTEDRAHSTSDDI